MIVRGPLPEMPTPPGITLTPVDDEAGVRDFVDVNAEAYATYGMPAEVQADLFDRPDAMLADDALHIVVARRDDGRPVATALAYEYDGVASLQWIGTVSDARGLGLGALVTTWATNLAFSRGASSVTLQASRMGEPVYRRLGYETLYRRHEYVRWPARRRGRGGQAD
jgi:GNAT superfamily N-acetyltransferase